MKKMLSILCLALLLPFCLVQAEEPMLALTGPDQIYPKDNFSLNLVADDKALTQIAFTLAYDEDDLAFYGIEVGDDWECSVLSARFTLRCHGNDAGGNMPEFCFKLNKVSQGTQFWVELRDVVILVGGLEHSLGTVRWEGTAGQKVKNNDLLESLQISYGALSPAFSPTIQNYTATVSYHVGAVDVQAVAQDTHADIKIHNPALTLGGVTEITVTVTAQSGDSRVYTILVTREEDPNRPKSSQCELESLTVADFFLSPAFQPEITEYVLWLPYEVTNVAVSGVPKDERATVTVDGNKRLQPGQDNPITITCRAEDGTEKVYTVIAKRASPHTEPTQSEETTPSQTQSIGMIQSPQGAAEPDVPSWNYVIIAVAAMTVGAALGILISGRKK